MTVRQNCWEFKQCGREPGGAKTDELVYVRQQLRLPVME